MSECILQLYHKAHMISGSWGLKHISDISDSITDSISWKYDSGYLDLEVFVNYKTQDVVFKILHFAVKNT